MAKGFINFELMRGKCSDIFTIYNCQTKWASKEKFLEWLNSDNFFEIREETPSNFSFHYSIPMHECYEQIIRENKIMANLWGKFDGKRGITLGIKFKIVDLPEPL